MTPRQSFALGCLAMVAPAILAGLALARIKRALDDMRATRKTQRDLRRSAIRGARQALIFVGVSALIVMVAYAAITKDG